MGFGDKLKGLREQAQQTVAENKDKLQGAVQVVGEAANNKTHGKYATKIAQVGEKVTGNIDKFADGAPEAEATEATAPAAEHAEPAAPAAEHAEPAAPAPEHAEPAAPAADHDDASAAPIAHQPANPVTPSAADEAASGFPEFD